MMKWQIKPVTVEQKLPALFNKRGHFANSTYLISLKNGLTLDISKYPELKKLGYWIVPGDCTNLRVWSPKAQPELADKFCEITGLKQSDFDIGSIAGLWYLY